MVWPLIASFAAPIIGQQIARAFGGGGNRGGGGRSPGLRAVDDRIGRLGERSEMAENEYWNRAMGFNPMEYANRASSAQFSMAMPQIQRAMGDLRGSQVASGRLRTGFGMGDQDTFMADTLANLNEQIAARSMQAAGMQQGMIGEMGRYATGGRDTYMDAALGRYYSDEDRRLAEESSRRGMWGNLAAAAIPSVLERVWQ